MIDDMINKERKKVKISNHPRM